MYQVRQNFIPYVFYMEFNVGHVVAYYDYSTCKMSYEDS